MNIIFMGTPDFSIPTLEALTKLHNVTLVVTTPDKPRGRGHEMRPTPIGAWADEHGIKVAKPATLKDGSFADTLDEHKPDCIVVVAYGKILPKYVLDYPKYGCINVHGSILPKYRGAAPMQRVVMNGESEIGVSIMRMAEGLDTGDVISISRAPLGIDDDFEYVHDTLSTLGAHALIEALNMLMNGTATYTPQDDSLSSYAKKIEKEDRLIDFTRAACDIHNTVRGLCPIPLAFCYLDGKMLKIKKTSISSSTNTTAEPGTVVNADKVISVACGDGKTIDITALVPEGKKPMDARSFVNGRGIAVGDKLDVQ